MPPFPCTAIRVTACAAATHMQLSQFRKRYWTSRTKKPRHFRGLVQNPDVSSDKRGPVGVWQRYEEATMCQRRPADPTDPGDAADLSIMGYF